MKKERLYGLDLFSGIGGNSLGLGEYIETIAYCEQDRHAQSVLLSRMGEGLLQPAPIWDDITTLNGKELEGQIDIIVGGFPCFVKDTLIMTKDGYKPIQDVELGEYVFTHKRRWKKVNQKHVTEGRSTRMVYGTGFLPILTTDEHPFYSKTRERTWNNSIRGYDTFFSDAGWVEAKDLKGKHVGVTFIDGPSSAQYSDEYLWLLGRCLADGWVVKRKDRGDGNSPGRVVLSCGKHENIENEISKCFNFCKVNEQTAIKYHITNKKFATHLSEFGHKAGGKYITNEILCLPKNKLKVFLDGYISGDGSYCPNKFVELSATTISKKLALTLSMALLKVHGRVPTIYRYKNPKTTTIEGRLVNQSEHTYHVKLNLKNRSSYVDISGEYGWGLCRKSVGNVSTDTVYNIGVEEDESYIADGVIVHNCQDLSVAGRGEGLAGKRSGLFYEIVRLAKEIKPKFLFLENVPAIRTRGLGTVLEELTKAGYDSRWCMLSASEVGAPHKRERWFLLACKSERPATNANSERLEGQRHISSGVKEKHPFIVEHGGWEVEPNLDRVAHGISYWVDKLAECIDDPECEQETLVSVAKSAIEAATINERIKRLGNAVVPLQAKTSFEILLGLRRNS